MIVTDEVYEMLMVKNEDGFYGHIGDDAAEAAWWAARGFDLEALKRWTVGQAVEDVDKMIELRVPLAPPQMIAILATAYHLGLAMGIRIRDVME